MGDLYGIFRRVDDVPTSINVTCETDSRKKVWKLLPLSTSSETNFDFKSIEVTVDEFVNAEFGIDECEFKKAPILMEGRDLRTAKISSRSYCALDRTVS